MRPRIHKITIAYDGTPFKGWQRQGKEPTVQLAIEDALAECWGRRITLHGAGRTDTGVHALAQVAHFEAPGKLPPATLVKALNSHLPPAVRITEARWMPPSFHSRFSATGKQYLYRVFNEPTFSPFEVHRAWHIPRRLNLAAIHQSTRCLIGQHDFASFTSNPGYKRITTVRIIRSISIRREGPVVLIRFRGSGFLYRMVRNLMGAFAKVGTGRFHPDEIRRILEARQRQAAPNTAPACGLYLSRVFYGKGGAQDPAGFSPEDEG